jgi:hypothetical protein
MFSELHVPGTMWHGSGLETNGEQEYQTGTDFNVAYFHCPSRNGLFNSEEENS